MARDALVVVHTYMNTFEAEVGLSALEAAGIEAMLRADDAGGVQPGLWTGRGVQLLVRDEDAERAREVLDTAARPE